MRNTGKHPKDFDFLVNTEPPDAGLLLVRAQRISLEALTQEHRRLFLWTVALSEEFDRSLLWQKIKGFRFPAFGFADPDTEDDTFGVLVYATPYGGASDQRFTLTIQNYQFPVFVRRYFEVHHSITIHPTGGRAACWATSSRVSKDAFLTAKHVAQQTLSGRSPQIGDAIPTNYGQGTVEDVAPDGIDAVLISPPQAGPTRGQKSLGCITCVAQWMDAALTFPTGTIRTKITSVTDTRGSLHYRLPCRVYFAAYGQPSDSGSLIIEPKTGEGIGLYMGSVTDAAGRNTEGVAQHLGQVVHTMGITLSE